MVEKRIIWISLILISLLMLMAAMGCGGGTKSPSLTLSPTLQPATPATPFAVINGHVFNLEIPESDDAFFRGLSNRTSLPEDSAMLFVYEQENYISFWMKDTLIPLDILFLDSSLKIVNMQTMQPEPGVSDYDLHFYTSGVPAKYAIEMNAGLIQKYGFANGMVVELNTDSSG